MIVANGEVLVSAANSTFKNISPVQLFKDYTKKVNNYVISMHSNIKYLDKKKSKKRVNMNFECIQINSLTFNNDRYEEVVTIVAANNYDEITKTISLTADHGVYTVNRGYAAAGQLKKTDVLVDNEGRPCKIVSKNNEKVNGSFFSIETKYGSNFLCNGLLVMTK